MEISVKEFEMAVLCAFQYASSSLKDANAQQMKAQAEQYCQAIKAHPMGYKYELELFEFSEHQEVKFYALQAIQELLSTRNNAIAQQQLTDVVSTQIRTELLAWLQQNVAFVETKAPYLKTKLAVVITLLIKRDYPERWPTAFTELMALLPLGASMVEMYFRILMAINEEIVEFDAQRSQQEAMHNMRIKDAMRESSCMADTFDAIYNVLVNCDVSAVMCELSYSALETLKRYISWVDIALIVNDRFIPILFKLLRESAALRCPAANCLFEIIDKGMTAEKKLALLQQLNLLSIIPTLPITDDDEFAEEIGEVVNAIGLELLECISQFQQDAQQTQQLAIASEMLVQLMPLVWDLFAHETKDVSEEVFEVVNAVGTMIQSEEQAMQQTNAVFQPSQYIPQIFHGIYRQTRYPEDSDSDAAEFEEYRRSLYKIYVNITRKRPTATLGFLSSLTSQLPPSFVEMDSRDLESYLMLVHRFKEGIAALKEVQALEEPNSPLTEMVLRIHTSMIAAAATGVTMHQTVLLTYYDLAVRYSRVLQNQSQLIPLVLEMMFGANGLTNPAPHVRSRVCYLCLRLVKALGANVHPYVAGILSALQPRLRIADELELMARQKQNDPMVLPFDDQLYLFELAGQVIASLTSAPEVLELKYQQTTAVLEPLLQTLNTSLVELSNGTAQDLVGKRCAKILNGIAHVLKAFKSTNCMLYQQEAFTQVLTAATCMLRTMPRHASVRSKVIFTLHRLITVLDSEHLLQNVPETLNLLMMASESSSDVTEVVQLLDQLIIKYKDALFPFFEQATIPFIDHLCAILPATTATDRETKDAPQLEKEAIQKYLFTFLLHLAMHNLDTVFVCPRNVAQLENVLRLVLEGCADVRDAQVNRACFTIGHELAKRWLLVANNNIPPESKALLTQFAVQQFTPAMFAITTKRHFDLKDVQCAAVIKEIATFQDVLCKCLGQEYLRFLQEVCLPSSLGVSLERATSYCQQIMTGNQKAIVDAYKAIVST